MTQPTLLFGALLSALSAAIYSRRRSSSPDARLAWRLFVAWWYALAIATLMGAFLNLFGALGITTLPLFTTITLMNLLATCVALYGLMFYLLYLFTGNRKLLVPLSVFYVVYYGLLVYYVQARSPISVSIGRWQTTLEYQNQIMGPFFWVLVILLLFPQILGSFAYFMLYFRVKPVTQKYRILLVSWSIIIWFLSAFLARIAGLSQYDWWQVTSRLIGLSAALTIMMAYQPPAWVKQRFGVASLAEESS
jgi:hypothetical protein